MYWVPVVANSRYVREMLLEEFMKSLLLPCAKENEPTKYVTNSASKFNLTRNT